MRIKRVSGLIMAVAVSVGLLAGCGESAEKPEAGSGTEQSGQESEQATESGEASQTAQGNETENQSDAGSSAEPGTPEAMLGEWSFVCSVYHSEDSESEPYEYVTMLTDEMAPESTIRIRKDGDKVLADYKYHEYEYYSKLYGAELSRLDTPPYSDDKEHTWCFELKDPFGDESDETPQRFFMQDKDTLVVSSEYFSEPDEEYQYHSLTKSIYLRKDSPEFDDPEELRYFDTVTVSTAEELLNSRQNNRKIILEGGTYNLTSSKLKGINSSKINTNYSTYEINNAYNVCFEAKDGAEVELCIDEPYDPVMTFNGGGNITFRGVTCGHHVEPGYCSGSVLYFDGTQGVTVDKCKLYGSGTYGIEANYTNRINVTDSDIYECTYGLVSLTNGYSATFKNCTLRDSSDLSMIYVNSNYEVLFEDCVFSGNRADAYDTCYFVEQGEYDRVTFRNCSFKDNKFYTFSNKEVTLENCTSDNNQAGFADLLKASSTGGVADKDTLKSSYETARKRQQEIDEKFQKDDLMDQQTMNQLSYEEYNNWDGLLNAIWAYLKDNLGEEKMKSVTEEQQKWIHEKEAAMKEAGAEFEGGSMQPMIEYGKGASLTQKRVEELMNQYINN